MENVTDIPSVVGVDTVPWVELRPGVDICRLFGDGRVGASAALLKYEPGARIPQHLHLGVEIIFIVRGSQTDGEGTIVANQVKVNRPGSRHAVMSQTGCVALLVWQAPVSFEDRD